MGSMPVCGNAPMATTANEAGSEIVGGGEEFAGAGGDHSHWQARPAMQAENGRGFGSDSAVEDAGADELLTPRAAFLGRLPEKLDADGEVIHKRFEEGGDADKDGGVPVVAAGMHSAGVGAGVRRAGLLGDRQRVDVGAEGDAGF